MSDLWLGFEGDSEDRVELPSQRLLRHLVCLGASGSGKTVACKVVCEELARRGVPVIAIDPQGDIASLALAAAAEDVEAKGVPGALVEDYTSQVEVVVWTPASSAGVPLSVNPLRQLEMPKSGAGREDRIRTLAAAAASVASVAGYDLASDDGRCVAGVLHLTLEHIARHRLPVRSFGALATLLADPPEALTESIEELLGERKLRDLRRKLQLLTVGAQQLLFDHGVPLDIDTLLGRGPTATPGKTRISVIYLNTLHTQAEKSFLVGQLAQGLYDWMLDHPSSEVQALLYIDEVAPFIPPVSKPACKDALTLLFKQARKYGVSCLLASQNPGDVDYKCLAQFSSWNLGRMMVRQDIKKVSGAVKSIAGEEADAIADSLPRLEAGRFVLLSPDEFDTPIDLRVRWLLTQHRTLDEEAVVNDPALAERLEQAGEPLLEARSAVTGAAVPAEHAPAAEASTTPQVVPAPETAELVERELCHARRALTVRELCDRMGESESSIRRAIKQLKAERRIEIAKVGRSHVHWHGGYTFYPEIGLVAPVHVARLACFEGEARAAARASTSGMMGLFGKQATRATFGHHPLWQIELTVLETQGALFWKTFRERTEWLYFHAGSGDLLLAESGGLRFVASVRDEPAQIRDLDDVAHFEEKTPDELGQIDRRLLGKMLTEKQVRAVVSRKFPVRPNASRLTFLPYWKIELDGAPAVEIDGVLGRPLQY